METLKHIAVFGGTFDPPTRAHQAIINACLDQLHIDEVWVMPSGDRTDKPEMSSATARKAMIELLIADAFAGDPRVQVCDVEMQLPQPTYTAQTYNALRETHDDAKFWFVFGADSYHDMPNWEEGEELQRTMAMLLMEREGFILPHPHETLRHLQVAKFEQPISSTLARQSLSEQRDAAQFITPAVENYIRETGLYAGTLA